MTNCHAYCYILTTLPTCLVADPILSLPLVTSSSDRPTNWNAPLSTDTPNLKKEPDQSRDKAGVASYETSETEVTTESPGIFTEVTIS